MLQLKPFLAKFGFVTDENEPSDRLFFCRGRAEYSINNAESRLVCSPGPQRMKRTGQASSRGSPATPPSR